MLLMTMMMMVSRDDFQINAIGVAGANTTDHHHHHHGTSSTMNNNVSLTKSVLSESQNDTAAFTSNSIDELFAFLQQNHSFHLLIKYNHQWHHYLDLIERSIDLNLAFKIILYIAYLLVFFIGMIGNVLVCYVVFRQSNMRTVTNIFISNLALSDILLCLFAVPFTPLYLLAYKEWVFGPIFCRLVPFVQGMSVYISSLTLMSIAIERYMVIIHPFQRHFTIEQCVRIILVIWIMAFILTLPYGIFIDVIPIPLPSMLITDQQHHSHTNKYHHAHYSMDTTTTPSTVIDDNYHYHHNENNSISDQKEQYYRALEHSLKNMLQNIHKKKWYCDEVWPNERLRLSFGIMTTIIQFVVPFIIIAFCYLKVFLRLWDRMRNRLGNRNYSSQRQWLEKERARRTNLMLIFMVAIFVISWLPLNTYNLIEDFYMPVTFWKHSRSLFMTFHLVAMSSICYNPFLYTWLNDNFRKEFQTIFSPLCAHIRKRCCCSISCVCHPNIHKTHKEKDYSLNTLPSANNAAHLLAHTDLDLRGDSTGITGLTNKKNGDDDDDGAGGAGGVAGSCNQAELISMTQIDTTTNMVTNLESINSAELQESLFITSLQNGVLASRIIYHNAIHNSNNPSNDNNNGNGNMINGLHNSSHILIHNQH